MEIKVNYSAKDTAKQKLENLRKKCDEIIIHKEDKVGSGESINRIDEMNGLTTDLKNNLLQLINNTISFLDSSVATVSDVDANAATSISMEG